MKQLLVLVCAIFGSTIAMANTAAGLNKGSAQLNSLSATWKTHGTSHQDTQKDITMVYGGDDVAHGGFELQPTVA